MQNDNCCLNTNFEYLNFGNITQSHVGFGYDTACKGMLAVEANATSLINSPKRRPAVLVVRHSSPSS
jgi:hypothetical protein